RGERAAPDQPAGGVAPLDQPSGGAARLFAIGVVHRQVELPEVEQLGARSRLLGSRERGDEGSTAPRHGRERAAEPDDRRRHASGFGRGGESTQITRAGSSPRTSYPCAVPAGVTITSPGSASML